MFAVGSLQICNWNETAHEVETAHEDRRGVNSRRNTWQPKSRRTALGALLALHILAVAVAGGRPVCALASMAASPGPIDSYSASMQITQNLNRNCVHVILYDF